MNKKYLLILVTSVLIICAVSFAIFTANKAVVKLKPLAKESSVSTVDDPNARMEYERRMLADPTTGKVPENIRKKELQFASTLQKVEQQGSLAKINTLTWSLLGPTNRGGRTRALGIDVRTGFPNVTIIAGGASGGIYKTINTGVSWVNKLSPDSIHSITSIVQDPRTGYQDTWYVGTGEASNNLIGGGYNGSASSFVGDGIYKSTDNGNTWVLLPTTSTGTPQSFSSQFNYVFNIAINKLTGYIFAAASNTIQRSTDGGTTWSKVLGGSALNNQATDVQITSTGVIYATIPYGSTHSGISKSIDNGNNWTTITPATIFPTTGFGRNVIGIAESDENLVYFWVYTPSMGPTQTQLWRWNNNNNLSGFWTVLTDNLPAPTGSVAGINVQGSYDMVIKVRPDNPNFVVIGGTNLYRSTDGFSTPISPTGSTGWIGGYAVANNVSQYANHHPDQHALAFLPSDYRVLFSGNDGGVFQTNDVTAASVLWFDKNFGYVTSQFYSLAIDPVTANSKVIAGGLQDNGNYVTFSNNYFTAWKDWGHGGDGGFAEVRKTSATEYMIYLEAQNGWLWRQTYNSTGTILTDNFIQPPYSGEFAFVNPFVLDPNDNNLMYFARGDSVIRSNNVSVGVPTWSPLANTTTGTAISAIGVSKSPANRLYVGSQSGKVLRLDNANTGNPALTANLSAALVAAGASAAGYVSNIYVDPSNTDKVIVVYANYSVRSLFYSSNGGTSWTNISGTLEQNADGSGNGPSCRWIDAITANGTTTYYVATSTGVYSTSNLVASPVTWLQEGSATIGNVVCAMIKARQSDGFIAVGTHGAGVFTTNQSVEEQPTILEQSFDTNTFPPTGWFLTPFNTDYTWKAGNITGLNFNTINPNSVNSAICPWVAQNQNEWLITPSFALGSGDARVEFYAAHSTDYLTNATLKLNVSTNFGTTWNTIWEAQNDGLGLKWRSISVDLTPYSNNQSVYLGWLYAGKDGDVVAIDGVKVAGNQFTTDITDNSNNIPKDFGLSQNYPNPFNPTTTIKFAIPQGKDVKISIYDITGKKISEVVNKFYNAGSYEVAWNGKNSQGSQVASGTYIYRLQAGEFIQTKKMLLLK